QSLNNLGALLHSLGQRKKALPYLERALAMHERLHGEGDHPDLAQSLNNLGLVLPSLGEPGKALPYCERALAMWERLYPKQDHPALALSLNNLGAVLEMLGRSGEALPYLERTLAMYRRLGEQNYLAPAQAFAHAAALPRTRDGYLSSSRERLTP